MTDYYSFHTYIQEAYIAVHEWLATQEDFKGYKTITSYSGCNDEKKPFKSAAAQYHLYFPAHFFKVKYSLESIISLEVLQNWLECNSHICLIDVGCGAGAGSIAFVETILRLKKAQQWTNPINIYCLGIDANYGTLPIYNQLMLQIKSKVMSSNIKLEHEVKPGPIMEAISSVLSSLENKRNSWNKPNLSQVLIINSTVVDWLKKQHDRKLIEYKKLKNLGIKSNLIVDNFREYSRTYALAYKQLFETIPIDSMSVITIGTGKDREPVQEMKNALAKEFKNSNHDLTSRQIIEHQVRYKNPKGSYYYQPSKIYPGKPFYTHVTTITNANLKEDLNWHGVLSMENLELAWARARHNFLREAIFSEVEIRVFENNLDYNLKNLQQQLMAYLEDIARTGDRIFYQIRKNPLNTRSRLLSRLEEEILSTAIVQKLGRKVDFLQHSYAYCLAKTDNSETEYLYEPWFDAYYKKFIAKACESAQKYENGIVIEVDIKDYYKQIFQNQLIGLASQQLHTEGSRIKWLLNVLLSDKLDNHEENRGITQGGISSGFFANLYLNSIDAVFGSKHNEWNLEFHRYADDMIFVIPNPEDEQSIMETLKKELEELGLCLNEDKSRRYEQVSDFFKRAKKDDVLDKLKKKYDKLVRPLWIMQSEYRELFEQHYQQESWWYFIGCYQSCLQSINIFVSKTYLSRLIYKNLFPATDYPQKKYGELNLPEFPRDKKSPRGWSEYFTNQNPVWINSKKQLRLELITRFEESYQILQESEDMLECQQAERRIRFVLNKLLTLGMEEIQESVIKIVCESPWILRYRLLFDLTESLARQGYDTQIMEILKYYEQ